jgi:hypothetical protein
MLTTLLNLLYLQFDSVSCETNNYKDNISIDVMFFVTDTSHYIIQQISSLALIFKEINS